MCEYDMELLLIMMDHDNIHNSFELKSHLGIKYQGFLIILPNLPMTFIAIYDIQLHITQLAPEMSYMTILNDCHNTNDIKVYPNQLQQLMIPANIRQFLNTTQKSRYDLQQLPQSHPTFAISTKHI